MFESRVRGCGMQKCFTISSLAVAGMLVFSSLLFSQAAKQPAAAKPQPRTSVTGTQPKTATPNLTGLWAQTRPPASAGDYWVYEFSTQEPPMTPWAEEQYRAAKPSFGPHGVSIADTNDPVYHGCFPPGVPRVYLHPFPLQIVQIPGQVTILYEYDNLSRRIYTDSQPHNTDLPPTWMGDSIGKWEEDTLVVDTTNFNDKTWLDRIGHPHSAALHLVERFRRVDPKNLQIEITIEDPKAYTKPWTAHLFYRLQPGWKLLEQFCEDNDSFLDLEKQETTIPAK
jgi:hypothetical protein